MVCRDSPSAEGKSSFLPVAFLARFAPAHALAKRISQFHTSIRRTGQFAFEWCTSLGPWPWALDTLSILFCLLTLLEAQGLIPVPFPLDVRQAPARKSLPTERRPGSLSVQFPTYLRTASSYPTHAGLSTFAARRWPHSVFPCCEYFFKVCLFVYLRESARRGGAETGRERERIPSRLCTVSTEPNVGLDPTTLGSWPEPKPRVRCLTNWAIQLPLIVSINT